MISAIDLEYSHADFKDILNAVTPIQDDKEKMSFEPFPRNNVLVYFAEKAYLDNLSTDLLEDWKLLTTAYSELNGYFGCAFYNSSQQQVVLAHRGTKPSNLGQWYADIQGVYLTNYTNYMSSAVTFGDEIKRAILDTNSRDNVHFTLTITGHSLGAWLAQVTAMTIKYLKRQNNEFALFSDTREALHTHTVTFDSPGVEDMVIKIQRDYGRYDSTNMFRSLDITTFFMAPNLVNATGYHIGAMYQVSSNLICTSGFKHMLSNLGTHNINNFVKPFQASDGKLFLVKDWPQGWAERKLMYKTKAEQPLHYEIGEEYLGTSVEINCFSELELTFIKWIRILRKNAIRSSRIETFFIAKSLRFRDMFPNFTIDRKNRIVSFDSKQDMEEFVKNTKNALRWFSRELQNVMEQQSKLSAPSLLFDMASQEFLLDSLPNLLACKETPWLCDFTKSTDRVLYVQAADCSLEMARIFNILSELDNTYDLNHWAFMDWTGLLKIDGLLTIKDLPDTLTNDRLLVVNFGSVADKPHPAQQILKNVFDNLKKYSEKKVVIVSYINQDLYKFVKSFEPELAVRCLPLSAQDCLEFRIEDLTDLSRQELFSRNFIVLGDQAMSLNALLGENCQSSDLINEMLKPFLKDVVTDERFILNITNDLLKFDKSDVMYSRVNKEVAPASLAELLREETNFVFVSSGARQLLAPLLLEVPDAMDRVLDIAGSSEEDFRQACLENSSIDVAYWLAATDGRLCVKQIYNTSFYLVRQFYDQSVVDLSKLVQNVNSSELFVFEGVDNKATLMRCLNVSPTVESLFCTNLKFQIRDSGENAEGIEQCINQHTIKVVKEGENCVLVRQNSQGPLDGLLPFLKTGHCLLNEEDLCDCKVVIISDQPGMGKSTTLTSLSRHLTQSWLVRMDLRDCRQEITNLPEEINIESATCFLAGADSKQTTLDLLQFCLQNQGSRQIHVLLDGFDEIRDKDAMEKVLKLCQFLKNKTTAKIIVTTRDSCKDVLVKWLSTFAMIFEKIPHKDQLNFLVNFWRSQAVLGPGGYRQLRDERLLLFAQHLHKAAHKKLGGDIFRLIGIPLQMRILAEAFLEQAEQFSRNTESIPNIIEINNVYNLYKSFTGVKHDIYLKEKISMSSDMIGSLGNMLYEKITENYCILAFKNLDPEFESKYLTVNMSIDEFKEIDRFGLTQWSRGIRCDFIHRTFAEYFCSHFLVLWLRQENFRFKYLPIKGWFLGNLLTNPDLNVVRMFLDEYLEENPLTESKQLLYNYISQHWFEDVNVLRDSDGQTALHVAVMEKNPNIIIFLLGGLATEETRRAFASFLLARDSDGKAALTGSLKILYERNNRRVPESKLFINVNNENSSEEDIVKEILKEMSNKPYEEKLNYLLIVLLEYNEFPSKSQLLFECELFAKEREDIQSAVDRIEVLENYATFYFIDHILDNNTPFIREFISNEMESDVVGEFLSLTQNDGSSAINMESNDEFIKLLKLFIGRVHKVLISSERKIPLHLVVANEYTDVVDLLINKIMRLDIFECSEMWSLPLIKLLLKRGPELSSLDANGRIALRLAMEKIHFNIALQLLFNEMDNHFMDQNIKTILHHARKSKWRKMAVFKIFRQRLSILYQEQI